VAVTVALGHLASLGVLVRDAGILEILPRVRTLVLDKTGTLTRGVPRVIAVRLAREAEWSEDEVLARAASVESDSHHPLARAIFEEAMRRRLVVPRAKAIEEIAGHGVRGRIDDELVDVTRPSAANDGAFEPLEDDAVSVVEVCSAGRAVARLSFEDALREEASEVVGTLRARGITLVIRSGDAPGAVARVASVLGIEDARGGLAPADKLTGLAPAARPLAMIGDGVNDAPALAEADVGFALGTRTEAALSAAGIALPRADLRLVVATHDLARRTVRVIRENLALAFAYNTLAIPFAALGAFDRIGGPTAAAIAMSLSSLLVVLNALRLRAGSGVMSRP
jgi:Cu+-exporting ATPase